MTALRPILPENCCCDDLAPKKSLIPVHEAVSIVSSVVGPVERMETLAFERIGGRVLADTAYAAAPVPPFANSAMDGFAVRIQDFRGDGPWTFPVSGNLSAGHGYGTGLHPKSVAQVMTGAPIPNGADTVVPQEHVTFANGFAVFLSRPIAASHVRYRGEDLQQGQPVIKGGSRLGASEIAALAAAGHRKVTVRGRVRVAVLATGDELRKSGEALDGSGIWDVNSPMLRSALQSVGAELVDTGSVLDDRRAMANELLRLAGISDLIVTTGGVSVGERDFVKAALVDAGGEIVFSGVAMKPGKPVSFGKIGRTCWLGLPGNPYAALVAWTLFGVPIHDALAGLSKARRMAIPAITATCLTHPTGRSEFRLARIEGFDGLGRTIVHCAAVTHSAKVSGLVEADGIAEIPPDVAKVPQAGLIRFYPF